MSTPIKDMHIDESTEAESAFTTIVELFLKECCLLGEQYSIEDKQLFTSFHTFWNHTTNHRSYPALLGQFRVALTQQGFHSSSGKHPIWYGLSLR